MKFELTKYQREIIIKFFTDLAKIFIAGLIFSNVFIKQKFTLGLTVTGFAAAIGLFIIALILGKSVR